MFELVLYNHIKDNFTIVGEFKYTSGNGANKPYIIQLKVTDPERPVVLCDAQGDVGQALFQFTGTGDSISSNPPMGAAQVAQHVEDFKNQLKLLIGVIGVTPNHYFIWNNITEGVRSLGEGENSTSISSAFFESTLWWNKL